MNIKPELEQLPGPILRDLARNESVPLINRKAAVEIMLERGYPEAGHPEFVMIVAEIRAAKEAKQEVEAVVETAIEAPLDDEPPKPTPILINAMRASVTTQSMYKDEEVK